MKYGKGGRKQTESSWRNGGQIPGTKAAKAGERQRHAEEARCQEEEAKRQAGEEQRALEKSRRVDGWRRKRRGKGKLKHEKCP